MSDSIRADLEAAMGDIDDTETQEEVLTGDELSNESQHEQVGQEGGEGSQEPAHAETADNAGEADAAAKPADQGDGGQSVSGDNPAGDGEVDTRSIKAPVSWGPQEREHWSKIPRNLQEKIMEREGQTETLMRETADARRTHSEFGGLVQQYGSALSGVVGDTPMEAVGNLFNTVANLRMGQPMEKAQIISDLMTDFGVDVAALDSILSGQMPEQGGNVELETMLNERMAPVNQLMEQMQRQEQQQHQGRQQAATQEVVGFANSGKAEFLNEVRHDMADWIDMAAKRGQNMSMEEAYQRACANHPEISGILAQREAQVKLTGGNNNMAAKKHAASSITGQRVGVNAPNGNMSLRDTLSSAWDAQGE